MTATTAQVHASAVSVFGKGCLITGASGSGKSTLCFELMALGARLVADDRVDLVLDGDAVRMSCPDALRGRIEARGVGLIDVRNSVSAVTCDLIVDLDQVAERLPHPQQRDLLGIPCPVIFGAKRPGLASIVHVLLQFGKMVDPEQGINP